MKTLEKPLQSKRFELLQDKIYRHFGGGNASFVCNAQAWDGFLFEHYTLIVQQGSYKTIAIQFMVKHFTFDGKDNGFQVFFETKGNSYNSIIDTIKILSK